VCQPTREIGREFEPASRHCPDPDFSSGVASRAL
jgi:hypothetical protein